MTEHRIPKKILNSKSEKKRKAEIKKGITGCHAEGKKEGETWEEIQEELGKTEIDTGAWLLGDPHESENLEGRIKGEKGCSVLHCAVHLATV